MGGAPITPPSSTAYPLASTSAHLTAAGMPPPRPQSSSAPELHSPPSPPPPSLARKLSEIGYLASDDTDAESVPSRGRSRSRSPPKLNPQPQASFPPAPSENAAAPQPSSQSHRERGHHGHRPRRLRSRPVGALHNHQRRCSNTTSDASRESSVHATAARTLEMLSMLSVLKARRLAAERVVALRQRVEGKKERRKLEHERAMTGCKGATPELDHLTRAESSELARTASPRFGTSGNGE